MLPSSVELTVGISSNLRPTAQGRGPERLFVPAAALQALQPNDGNRYLAVSDIQSYRAANSWRPGSHSLGNCDDIVVGANGVVSVVECDHRGALAPLFIYSCLE